MRSSALYAERRGGALRCRGLDGNWVELTSHLPSFSSMLTEFSDPERSLDLMTLREVIRSWRFYDHFRTDCDAPSRQIQVGTHTPVLADDGADLAAALQTILEIGDYPALQSAIDDAFPGSELLIDTESTRFQVLLRQPGLLRPLAASELSDGTLRYLLLLAALLSPRPPELLVLNEPETSLHPELIPALGRVIAARSSTSQILIVTHSTALIDSLASAQHCAPIELEKVYGATQLVGVNQFDIPRWNWPKR